MGAVAVKQSSNDTTKKNKVNEQIPGTAEASIFSSPDVAIQRSPSCPCGGGCPRCRGVIQPKLIINQPGDIYEQEADRVAEQVMRMPDPSSVSQSPVNSRSVKPSFQSISPHSEKDIQRKEDDDEEEGIVQMKPVSSSHADGNQQEVPPSVHKVLSSPGFPLDPATRAYMEPRFGHDFSRVRVYTGTAAEQSARDVNANAYTARQNIVFGMGKFAPRTETGRRLLAHELVHVVQQSQAGQVSGVPSTGQVGPVQSPMPQLLQRDSTSVQPASTKQDNDDFIVYQVKIPPGTGTEIELTRYVETIIFGRVVNAKWEPTSPDVASRLSNPAKHVAERINFRVRRSELFKFGVTRRSDAEQAASNAAYFQLGPDERAEIDRRFFQSVGDQNGVKISKGEVAKAAIWHSFKHQFLAEKQKIEALPEEVLALLGEPWELTPDRFNILMPLVNRLSNMSKQEFDDFMSTARFQRGNIAQLTAALDAYDAAIAQRMKEQESRESLVQSLYGLEDLYHQYKQFDVRPGPGTTRLITPIKPLEMEKEARDKNVQGAGHEANELRIKAGKLRTEMVKHFAASLKAHGFNNLYEFEQVLDAYEAAFLKETMAIANGVLDKLDHKLWEAEQVYSQDQGVDELLAAVQASIAPQKLAQADKLMAEADRLRQESNRTTVQVPAPVPNKLTKEASRKQQEAMQLIGQASQAVRDLKGQPLIADEKFPRYQLMSNDRAIAKPAILNYIKGRRENIKTSRDELRDDPKMVYKLPKVMAASFAEQLIQPGSIYFELIVDRQRNYKGNQSRFDLLLTLISLALLFVPGGVIIRAVAAAGSLAISAYQAHEQYKEYEKQAALADTGLANEPSLGWVILAVVGAGFDLGIAVRSLAGIKDALLAFSKARNAKALEGLAVALEKLPQELRQTVLKAAVAEIEANEALLKFGTKVSSSLNAGAAGLNAVPELSVALYQFGKRGYINFGLFMQEMKAAKLIDEARITAEEITRLKTMFDEARNVVNDVSKAGKELGLNKSEIGGFLKQMAADPSLTMNKVKAAMAEVAAAKPGSVLGAAEESLKPASSEAAKRRVHLDLKAREQAVSKLERAEKEISEKVTSIHAENAAVESARKQLKVLSDSPKPAPAGLEIEMKNINKLKTLEEKIEALDMLKRTSKSASDEEKAFLTWRKRTWELQKEIQEAEETARHLSKKLEDPLTAKQAAIAEIREESKDLIDIMRKEGPNYRDTKNVKVDQVMSLDAWEALPRPKPALATDHLVSLDRISKRPELNELLGLYTQASPGVKAEIKAALEGIGDIQSNLVRMNHQFNSGVKGNKSWHEITYEQAKKAGYTSANVDAIRALEDAQLTRILEKIKELTSSFRVKIKGKLP